MTTYLPDEVRDGLRPGRPASAAKRRRRKGLRLVADGTSHGVLRVWSGGLAMPDDTPHLRGFVDLYDGARHIGRCLIVATSEEDGERRFEFKRAPVAGTDPPIDFERDAALIATDPLDEPQ